MIFSGAYPREKKQAVHRGAGEGTRTGAAAQVTDVMLEKVRKCANTLKRWAVAVNRVLKLFCRFEFGELTGKENPLLSTSAQLTSAARAQAWPECAHSCRWVTQSDCNTATARRSFASCGSSLPALQWERMSASSVFSQKKPSGLSLCPVNNPTHIDSQRHVCTSTRIVRVIVDVRCAFQ